MARTQTMVQLSDRLVERLDHEAARRGVSRSSLIREAVETMLDLTSESAEAERLVAAYRAVPPALPDTWGDLTRMSDVSTRETMQRLDAEERAAGFELW